MEDEIAYWLMECYKEGSFTVDEANEVIKQENIVFSDNRVAHDLWEGYFDYIGSHEKVNIIKEACEMFLLRLKKESSRQE